MIDINGKLWSIQAIFPEIHPILGNNKDFMPEDGKKGYSMLLVNQDLKSLFVKAMPLAPVCTLPQITRFCVQWTRTICFMLQKQYAPLITVKK